MSLDRTPRRRPIQGVARATEDISDLGLDEEMMQADQARMDLINEEERADSSMDEDHAAELFGDFEPDGDTEQRMVDSLIEAGVAKLDTSEAAGQMFSTRPVSDATYVEVYGKSIADYAQASRRDLNAKGLGSLDFRTLKANGEPWNCCKTADRQEARALIDKWQSEWIIGAPPCTPFSIWNHGISVKNMKKEDVENMHDEGKLHVRFVCNLYRRQAEQGRYVLHERPASAMSWHEEDIRSLASHPLIRTVVGDQCMYGLVTPSQEDRSKCVPAMKPTRFMTSSTIMRDLLSRRCDKSHSHQPLAGGRCNDAAYPAKLVRAILRGNSLQREHDRQLHQAAKEEKNFINAMPMNLPSQSTSRCYAFGEPKKSSIPKMTGGSVPIVFN